MPKRPKTSSVRFDDKDLVRLERVRELRGLPLSITDILREALAAHVAQLERKSTVMTTDLRVEIREIVRAEITASLREIVKALKAEEARGPAVVGRSPGLLEGLAEVERIMGLYRRPSAAAATKRRPVTKAKQPASPKEIRRSTPVRAPPATTHVISGAVQVKSK